MKRATNIAKTKTSRSTVHIVSPNERTAAGKALREKIPRQQQGRWSEFKERPDPIDLLHRSDAGRMKKLLSVRYGRMLESPFAFYRGAAGVMAADLARTSTTGLKVQACGDCHLLNFGGFATPERNVIFDINDFDETSPAPWEWDVKRLAASIMLAARSNGISDDQGRECAVSCARRYREHMHEFSKMNPLRVWYAETSANDFIGSLPKAMQNGVKKRIEKTAAHSGSEFDFPKLARSAGGQIRITDQPPLIFHPEIISTSGAAAALDKLSTNFFTPTDNRFLMTDARFSIGIGSLTSPLRWSVWAVSVGGVGSP
jgi:hypothetical protein